MSRMNTVRKGVALLLLGVVLYVLGWRLDTVAATEDLAATARLGGVAFGLVGLVWVLRGLWRNDSAEVEH